MKRLSICLASLLVFGVVAAAQATGVSVLHVKLTTTPNKAGTPSKPSPLGLTLDYKVALGAVSPGGLGTITSKIYGLVSNGRDFPICTSSQITSAGSDAMCPQGSLVGGGSLQFSIPGPPSSGGQTTCNKTLRLYNAGQGKLTFDYLTGPLSLCDSNAYYQIAPIQGTILSSGRYLTITQPLPGVSSSLPTALIPEGFTYEITIDKQTTVIKGKNVGFTESVACKGHERPLSFEYAFPKPGSFRSISESGKLRCTK